MKEKYYERLKALSKDPNSSMLFWGYEARAILKEIERLHSIIKEVREKIENTQFAFDFEREINTLAFDLTFTKEGRELLKILDKVSDKE